MDNYTISEEAYKKGFIDGQKSVLNILKILVSQKEENQSDLILQVERALKCQKN